MYVPRSGVEVEEEVHPIGEPGQHWTVGLIEPGLGEAWIGGRIQQTACRGQDTAGSRYRRRNTSFSRLGQDSASSWKEAGHS